MRRKRDRGGSTRSSREFNRYLHSNMRLRARYGIEMDFDQYLEACELFKHGRANGIRVQNAVGDLEGWICLEGKWVCAHYKIGEGLIATFLPAPLTPEPCPKCSLETE